MISVRRGLFLQSLEEDIQIRRERPQRQRGQDEFTYPLGEAQFKALIRPVKTDADVETVVTQDFHYLCNLTPVRPEIKLNDQVVRNLGESNEQVLTITFIDSVEGIQQLQLRDTQTRIE